MARPRNPTLGERVGQSAEPEAAGAGEGRLSSPGCACACSCAHLCVPGFAVCPPHTHTPHKGLTVLLAAPGISPRHSPALPQPPRRAPPALRGSCAAFARISRAPAEPRHERRAAVPGVLRDPAEFCRAENFLPSNE